METGDALHTSGQTATAEAFAVLVLHEHIVVGFSPVHTYEYHRLLLWSSGTNTEPEGPAATQWTSAQSTTSHQPSTGPHHQQGHDLVLELEALGHAVLTGWRLSLTSLTYSRSEVADPIRDANGERPFGVRRMADCSAPEERASNEKTTG